MARMKALKTFRVSENSQIVHAGDEFEVRKHAREYESRGLAVKIKPLAADVVAKLENKAAQTGPLASPGGLTGADKRPSSSPPDQAPKKRRSTKSSEARLEL